MSNKEINLENGDVIESGVHQWLYDGDPEWIIIKFLQSSRVVARTYEAGHTVDLSTYDVWRDGKKLEVPVEPEPVKTYTFQQALEAMKAEPGALWIGPETWGLDDSTCRWNPSGYLEHKNNGYGTWVRTALIESQTGDWRPLDGKPYPLPVEPESEWIECEPSDATMVRIGGVEFEVDDNSVYLGQHGNIRVVLGVDTYQRMSLDKWKLLKATFHKKKPSEPVVVEKEFDLLGDASEFLSRLLYKNIGLDPAQNIRIKITFEQEAK